MLRPARLNSLAPLEQKALHSFVQCSKRVVVGWNYSRQAAPQGRLSRSRMNQHRPVKPMAIAGVRCAYFCRPTGTASG
ncbi:hypothetical protein D3875_20055 [Deinococcus cavernae]|uniref:Uncharacterized protein n=1 Tax=Deinococcus cavernae TaxID=2320857 RepID=A0A418VCN0_9DEIO|nr:hypothetical protein D3875_20055 [Deinococcus cavernae]